MNLFTLENFYLRQLENLQTRFLRGLMSQKERDAGLRTNMSWFSNMRYLGQIEDEGCQITYCLDLPADVRSKYKHSELGEVAYILRYRNHDIPVYDDDAGQQEVAIIFDHEVAGGAYNMTAVSDFCTAFDEYFESILLQSITRDADGHIDYDLFNELIRNDAA